MSGQDAVAVTETIAVDPLVRQDRAQSIAQTLSACLAELDALSADVAAAHLDTALQALCRQFDLMIVPEQAPNSEDG